MLCSSTPQGPRKSPVTEKALCPQSCRGCGRKQNKATEPKTLDTQTHASHGGGRNITATLQGRTCRAQQQQWSRVHTSRSCCFLFGTWGPHSHSGLLGWPCPPLWHSPALPSVPRRAASCWPEPGVDTELVLLVLGKGQRHSLPPRRVDCRPDANCRATPSPAQGLLQKPGQPRLLSPLQTRLTSRVAKCVLGCSV